MNSLGELLFGLEHFARKGDVHKALLVEAKLYTDFVKTTESDEHYQKTVSRWARELEKLGESRKAEPSKGDGVAFFLHSSGVLAHTDIVAEVIRLRPAYARPIVVCFNKPTDELKAVFDCPVFGLTEEGPFDETFDIRFDRMRELLKAHNIGTVIWISVPVYCSYVFGSRIAEHQVYWSLRFHPLCGLSSIDQFICGGSREEKTREYFGQVWEVAHSPQSVRLGDITEFTKYRREVPFSPCFGTIAREEKIAVPEYLEAVRRIVSEFPEGGFLWTGRKELPEITDFFHKNRIPNSFMGWVEPNRFSALLDCYLETFPLGGLCTFQAMGHGIPIVALKNPHSRFGCIETLPEGLLAASSVDEYVRMALDAIRSPETRQKAVKAGLELFRSEEERSREDAEQFWELIS